MKLRSPHVAPMSRKYHTRRSHLTLAAVATVACSMGDMLPSSSELLLSWCTFLACWK